MPCFGPRSIVGLAILLFAAIECSGQQKSSATAPSASPVSSAQGSLAVTVTVVSSATVVIDTDGTQKLVVANAPDNVSPPQYIPLKPAKQTAEPKSVEKDKVRQEMPR